MVFKSKDEREAKKAERIDDLASRSTEPALRTLRRRRAWIISSLARDRHGMTGGALKDEVDDHARALFYLDQAIASLTNDPGEEEPD